MTNDQKNQVIAGKLFCIHKYLNAGGYWYKCEKCGKESQGGSTPLQIIPDFFTPEGQVILAKALIEDYAQNHGASVGCHFCCYLEDKAIEGEGLLELIAKTKLAELFYEFVEGEKDVQSD